MKRILCSLLLVGALSGTAFADIQDPPMNDFGVTRKLSRGVSNILFGITEIPINIATINHYEGNSAAASYGIIRGVGRAAARFAYGWYEVLLAPFPTERASYRPPYRDIVPWIHSGYQEFPPELGWESRFDYGRSTSPVN